MQIPVFSRLLGSACFAAILATSTFAQAQTPIPPALGAPDSIDTRIGTLEFKDGVPSAKTAEMVYDTIAFANGLAVYNNSFRGASALAIRNGFVSIGAADNDVVIFSELMDANSLFLTANADTVYYMSAVDLTNGPMVIEQPPAGLGTINDMWFSWVIDDRRSACLRPIHLQSPPPNRPRRR